jgi:translation elongation factor P/translation initiation factor 5A
MLRNEKKDCGGISNWKSGVSISEKAVRMKDKKLKSGNKKRKTSKVSSGVEEQKERKCEATVSDMDGAD